MAAAGSMRNRPARLWNLWSMFPDPLREWKNTENFILILTRIMQIQWALWGSLSWLDLFVRLLVTAQFLFKWDSFIVNVDEMRWSSKQGGIHGRISRVMQFVYWLINSTTVSAPIWLHCLLTPLQTIAISCAVQTGAPSVWGISYSYIDLSWVILRADSFWSTQLHVKMHIPSISERIWRETKTP